MITRFPKECKTAAVTFAQRRKKITAAFFLCLLTACTSQPDIPSYPSAPLPMGTGDIVTLSPLTEPLETAPPLPPVLSIPEGMTTELTDPALSGLLASIAALTERYGLSVVCQGEDGTLYFAVRETELYPAASTVKPIFCHYLLESGADPAEEILFEEATLLSASGKLTAAAEGSTFTVGELIEYSIRYSDSMAYRLLFNHFGSAGYNRFLKALGLATPKLWRTFEYCDVTAADLHACTAYIAAAEDTTVLTHMKHTTYNDALSAGTDYEIAHKYGYEGGDLGFHDTAIVYAPHPFIITVMSHIDVNRYGAEPFREIMALASAVNAWMTGEET